MYAKPLCDWTRTEMKQEKDLIFEIKVDPKFECGKCRRWANRRCWLCEPVKLSEPSVKPAVA